MTEAVGFITGERLDGAGHDNVRPAAATACWAALATAAACLGRPARAANDRETQRSRMDARQVQT
jgi:hypothetical protein